MAVQASLDYRLNTNSPAGIGIAQTNQSRWTPGAGTGGKRETVSLTGSAFTALSPPSGSKLLVIVLGAAVSLTLKGITGDSASITLTPATNPLGLDAMIPLGATPVIGILNGVVTAQTVECIWL